MRREASTRYIVRNRLYRIQRSIGNPSHQTCGRINVTTSLQRGLPTPLCSSARQGLWFAAALLIFCCGVSAQVEPDEVPPGVAASSPVVGKSQLHPDYTPITLRGRVKWWFKATMGPTSLFDGMIVAGYQTGLKHPPEWGSGWDGFGRRYALRMSGIGLSTAIEGTIGAAWGEDPRYFRAGEGSFGSRIKHVAAGTFMDRYRDGSYRPAMARFIAIPTSNYITNAWRPASETSGADVGMRIGLGFAGKMGSNAFKEFWPDVSNHLFHRH